MKSTTKMFKNSLLLTIIYFCSSFNIEHASLCIKKDADDPIIADFFSPNGDGHNDTFVVENIKDFPINKMFIFNRWGEYVYVSEPYHNEWDGTNNLEKPLMGKELPEGLYFYRFEYFKGDFRSTVSGKIILKR